MTDTVSMWKDNYSDLPLFTDKDRRGEDTHADTLLKMQVGIAYPCEVSQAQIIKSDHSGDVQMAVTYMCPGYRPKSVWLTLPMQASDMQKDKTFVQWVTQRRMIDFERLYSCAQPALYALYETRKQTLDVTEWYDFDGKLMMQDEFDARKLAIRERLKETVEQLHGRMGATIREVEGTKLYVVMVENQKKPAYPFVNLYRTPPANVPLAEPSSAPWDDKAVHPSDVPF